jgi:hypothetical protein
MLFAPLLILSDGMEAPWRILMRSFSSYLPIYILILFLVCSCSSRIPEPIGYPYSQQKKMQASFHWEVLAADLANRINKELILSGNLEKAVFVKETCGDDKNPCQPNETSSFNEAFRDLLITNLFGYGVPTKNRLDEEAIEVLYKVQIVRHNTDRVRSMQPGLITTLSTAVVVLRNAPIDLILLASGIAADVANTSLVTNGHIEVIITTSMITRDQYIFRASDIYYINEKDFYHYQDTMPQTKTIKLSSGKPSKQINTIKPLPTATMENPEEKTTGTDSAHKTNRHREVAS